MRGKKRLVGEGSASHHTILELFRSRPGTYLSGEELSRLLGVTRTSVWKQIHALKNLGYAIDGIPSRGYRLLSSPDILSAAELETKGTRIGSRIVSLTETDSTNTVAFRLAEEGAEEGTVVIADRQLKGRGRMGRQWTSPGGVNIYCSVIARPPIEPMKATQLTFLSSVAVARSIEQSSNLRPVIKWPNDVLINGKKVAGLLNELSAETERVNFVILGIGININMGPELFPEDLRHPATSMMIESGVITSRVAVARQLISCLDDLYGRYLTEGYEPVRQEWLDRCGMIGKNVVVTTGGGEIIGRAVGVDDYGALLLDVSGDGRERILAGYVKIAE